MSVKMKIGLETHVQLNSATKMFCGCRNPANLKGDTPPNTVVCPTCMGMPGSKPQANKKAVELALAVSIALGCRVQRQTFFSRKTYFYPDMAKNYQISQYESPIAKEGVLRIGAGGLKKAVRIRRIQMEEDPAKLVHVGGEERLRKDGATRGLDAGEEEKYVLVDYNRSGIPLVEIVTEPDFDSPAEARAYLQKLAIILEYLGVYSAASEASIKTDANISISGGERVEIKNITGTKEIEKALGFEYMRQKNALARGARIEQETRAWDDVAGVTRSMRKKETEEEYGYIFEPDLAKIIISDSLKKKISGKIPELPDEKMRRFVRQYKISDAAAESMASSLDIAGLFEKAAKAVSVGVAASWISERLLKTLNYNKLAWRDCGLKAEWVIDLLRSFEEGKYSDDVAEQILWKMIEDRQPPGTVAKRHGFAAIDRTLDIDKIISGILEKNPKAVEDYKKGEAKALNFLVGQLMRETKGAVDAKRAREEILKKLKERD